jgi:hypothetical protein
MRKIWLPVFGLTLLAVFAVFALAQETNVAGEWDFTMQSPRGERTMVVKFTQEGEKITVTMPGFRGGNEITGEGTVKGKDIQWSITRTTPDGNEFTVTYKGTVEGTTMSGTTEMGQMGTMEWKATKK